MSHLTERDGPSRQVDASTSQDYGPKTTENVALMDLSKRNLIVGTGPIEIDVEDQIQSVQFLPDGQHVVSAGNSGKIRQWRVADGKEVGMPMDAGSLVWNLAVSRDGKWIVAGTSNRRVTAWNAITHEKAIAFKAHSNGVYAVDISPDSTRIATGSLDYTLSVWSLLTGKLLLGPSRHDNWVVAVKLSPNGQLIATATHERESVRVYDGEGQLLAQFLIDANTALNGSLAWTNDGKQLYVLSEEGDVHCLEVSTGTTLSERSICDKDQAHYIALAPNDGFIAASGDSSFTLWDTTTHQCLVSVTIPHSGLISPMAISPNYDIVVALENKIILRRLLDILPSHYHSNISLEPERRYSSIENVDFRDTNANQAASIASLEEVIQRLRERLTLSNNDNWSLRAQLNDTKNRLDKTIADLEKYAGLHDQLAIANEENKTLRHTNQFLRAQEQHFNNQSNETIKALTDSERKLSVVDNAVQGLTDQLALSQCTLRVYEEKHQCETMYTRGHVYDAAQHLLNLINNMNEDLKHNELIMDWLEDFQQRCAKKLEKCADTAKDHSAAIKYYSSALLLDPTNINDIIVKCCKARTAFLQEELVSVAKVIGHDPSDYRGYKRKYSILRGMGRYKEAFDAFETMLLVMKNSTEPQVCKFQSRYLDTTPLIRKFVNDTLRDIPRVLIDTATGRLYDKRQQAAVFEEQLIFYELRCSMTTDDCLDYPRIKKEVERFYRYVMFSHRWQPAEPTFQMVENISIYASESPIIEKLVNFCKVVQSRGFRWAWSDTCCVNQADKGVQQESVVAMFRWYCHAALTIVHLLGVFSESQQEGDLWKSIWNTRGWTYQEYVASRVIQFYTEDWKQYLNLKMFNHKESSIILSEMEQATEFATERLVMIKPGLDRVREKLYLASKRQTTREEDIAYSLFGIFDVSLPVIYGEGKQAVRRLLEHILTQSDDVTLLSWTGNPGSSTKSYLPSDFTVYDQISPPHVPQAIEATEMKRMVMDLRSSFPDHSPIVALYERLLDLPPLSHVPGRPRLHGLVFHLSDFAHLAAPESDSSLHVYHATAPMLGEVRIETKDDSLDMRHLVLVHPWIGPLLDEDFLGGIPQFDLGTRALRFVVRLRQPFGGLLLALQKRGQYRRVATDSLIQVQIRAETSLSELMASIGAVDVN